MLFLTLYDQLIKKEKIIIDYDGIYAKLKNSSNNTIIITSGGGSWSAKEKTDLVAKVGAILQPYLRDRTGDDPMLYSYATEIETLLKQSETENAQYDFKQGIHDLNDGTKNKDLLKKIFKTLSCMGNTEKNAKGYVLIGISDCFEDAQKIKTKYSTSYIKVGSFYITGVNGEVASFYSGNYDAYFNVYKNAIEHLPMSDHYKRQIGSKMRMVNYNGKTIIILRIQSDNGAVMFDNNYYTRIGPNNDPTPVPALDMPDFFAQFS